jgi:hypothetical protein
MIPDDRTENLEPPECDMDDQPVMCETCGSLLREANVEYCPDCERERDEINGIQPNGTEETVKIALPKFKTTDGRGTCGLDWQHDHLRCQFARAKNWGKEYWCAWTGSSIHPDNPDGSGYLRPCENCPIHKSP